MATNRFSDKFSVGKIGTGSTFTKGSMTSKKAMGLAKALRSAKAAGKFSYAANLSKRDLDTLHRLIGDEMKKLSVGSSGLGYKARNRIMAKAEQMRKQGVISSADKDDLRNIVGSLGQKARASASAAPAEKKSRPTARVSGRVSGSPWNQSGMAPGKIELTPQQQKMVRMNIKADIAEEVAAEDDLAPRAFTSMSQKLEFEKKQAKQSAAPKARPKPPSSVLPPKSPGHGTELPDWKNLPDIDIG